MQKSEEKKSGLEKSKGEENLVAHPHQTFPENYTHEANLPASTCKIGCWSCTSNIRSSGLNCGGVGEYILRMPW